MAGDSFLLAFHSELNENRINYNKEFFCTCDIIFCLFKSVVEAGDRIGQWLILPGRFGSHRRNHAGLGDEDSDVTDWRCDTVAFYRNWQHVARTQLLTPVSLFSSAAPSFLF